MKKKIPFALPLLAAAFALSTPAWAQTMETTTSTAAPAGLNSMGTISEFSPDMITVRSESADAPIHYSYSKSTTYVDDAGAPVSMDTVKSGLPVTVYYTQVDGQMVASRVIVRRATTTTTAAPVVEEKKTTTTTTEQ
jgi:hypothetical protein